MGKPWTRYGLTMDSPWTKVRGCLREANRYAPGSWEGFYGYCAISWEGGFTILF
ncbi:hypothetical protein [Pustulibacterium marinum]|uniref:hypothetical protein n=1 Tax=Pustulibacterium marinum TaxID=1224947 RepID=UPI0015A690DC|nr:hypothetical protein [Pustulibacterium marinum]